MPGERSYERNPEFRNEAERLRRRKHNPFLDQGPPPDWPMLDEAALQGLPGDVVRAIAPASEADPVALLVQYLVAAGNVIGRGPHYRVEGDQHGPNLFAVIVGDSSKSRKGTSWGRIRQIMEVADPEWMRARRVGGMSSGEGLIAPVRDAVIGHPKDGKNWIESEITPGVADKRLMVIEAEFSSALAVMKREGNTLSSIIREAWDRGDLATMTKNSPLRATGAHISILGHITTDELRADLDKVSMCNGFGNRFLWLMVRRSKTLPFGGVIDDETIATLARRTREAIVVAQGFERVGLSTPAREMWRAVYPALSASSPGLLGALTARAEAQVIRLGLIYALLNQRDQIAVKHLEAAIALWDYADASVDFIFGDMLGDPTADAILQKLREVGPTGCSRTEIRDLFVRHRTTEQLNRALARLEAADKAKKTERETGGRRAEVWVAVVQDK